MMENKYEAGSQEWRKFIEDKMRARAFIESNYEWMKWTQEIPSINFPSSWGVKVIPPFGGAIARFVITKANARVSVYLDCYGELGAWYVPHWELYPDAEGDNYRVAMNDTDELLKHIAESLDQQIQNGGHSDA